MRGTRRLAMVIVALVILSVCAVFATGVTGASGTPGVDVQGAADVVTVHVTQSFAAHPEPGLVTATYDFTLPDAVEELRTRIPENARAVSTSGGFEHAGGDQYIWDGGTQTPAITFQLPVNETGSISGPEGTDGRFRFADVGEWGLFTRPPIPIDVSYYGDEVEFVRETAVDGDGAAGKWLVFVGSATIHRHTAANQDFRLVEPGAADLAEPPERIFEAVGSAANALQVGSRDRRVLMVAAPATVDWAVEGLAVGGGDFYVTDDERLDVADSTWLHEYVHTRQSFNLTEETRWLTEATATYYAALLTLEQEQVSFPEFKDLLRTGRWDRFTDDILADPSTWTAGTNYRKGGLVIGELDRRLRLATDQQRAFQAVFSEVNQHPEPLSGDAFITIMDRLGGADLGDAADRFTRTTATPPMWDQEAHQTAFGQLPARISVRLDERFRVTGPYRNRSIRDESLVVVPGEQLSANLSIENLGGTKGTYNLSYGLSDIGRTWANGTVAPGTTVVEHLSVEPEQVGQTTFHAGQFERSLTVREPARPTIVDITANRTSVPIGKPVRVDLELRNGESYPGHRNVTITANGAAVTTITAYLDGNEMQTRSVVVRPSEIGSGEISAGELSIDIRVTTPDDSTSMGSPSATAGGNGGGVGPIVSLLTVGLVVIIVGVTKSGSRSNEG
ncbi:MAG: hypothetical protein ABEH64_02340 [Salinirussus sp.]